MEAVEFMKKLDELIELGRSKKDVLSIKEINDYFKGIDLTADQMDMVYQYLEEKKIDVMQISEEQMAEVPIFDTLDDDLQPTDEELEEEEHENVDLDAINLLEGIGTEDPVRMYLKEIGSVALLPAVEEH